MAAQSYDPRRNKSRLVQPDDLAGVHDVVGVEGLLQVAHQA